MMYAVMLPSLPGLNVHTHQRPKLKELQQCTTALAGKQDKCEISVTSGIRINSVPTMRSWRIVRIYWIDWGAKNFL